MQTAINFRDFGGAPSGFGGHVRRDRLFRSGHLATIDADDAKKLLALDISVVADLRYSGERAINPSPWRSTKPPLMLTHDSTRSLQAPHIELLKWVRAGGVSMKDRAIGFYRTLPLNIHYRTLFGAVLCHLSRTDGRVLVHCTAGKDRTGILCALILHALGVSRDAIIRDYMLSRGGQGLSDLAASTASSLAEELGVERAAELVARMYDVDEDYLLSAFEGIERNSGSIDAYLQSLGLDEPRARELQKRFLI